MYTRLGWLLVLAFLAGCGGGEAHKPAAPAATGETAAREPTEEQERPLTTGALKPGRYETTRFRPTVSFTVGKGWTASPQEPVFFGLARRDFLVAFVRPPRVVDPRRTYRSFDVPDDALLPAPRDLLGWLATHPRHNAGTRFPARVGDVSGMGLDFTVASGYRAAGCATPCVYTFAIAPDFILFATEGQKIRSIVVEVAGENVLVAILAPEQKFEQAVREAERVLAAVEFGG